MFFLRVQHSQAHPSQNRTTILQIIKMANIIQGTQFTGTIMAWHTVYTICDQKEFEDYETRH